MDNYDLSNLPLLGQRADSGGYHPWLTDEENRRATFSRRSAIVTAPEQTERQQLPSAGDEQVSEQRALADFDISLTSTTSATIAATVDEPEDPFAALAVYASSVVCLCQLLTFNDGSGQPLNSNLGLFGNINTSSEVVLGELEGNDVVEQPEQSQGESDTQGIIISESTIPDTVPDKRSGKQRASEPRFSTKESSDLHVHDFLLRSGGLTKRQKLDRTETESTRQSAAMPKKSATCRAYTYRQNPDKSLRDRVNEETNKWIVVGEGRQEQFMCGYLNCDYASKKLSYLRTHIFQHIGISRYKYTYPECARL